MTTDDSVDYFETIITITDVVGILTYLTYVLKIEYLMQKNRSFV